MSSMARLFLKCKIKTHKLFMMKPMSLLLIIKTMVTSSMVMNNNTNMMIQVIRMMVDRCSTKLSVKRINKRMEVMSTIRSGQKEENKISESTQILVISTE